MEIFSQLLAVCAGNSPVIGEVVATYKIVTKSYHHSSSNDNTFLLEHLDYEVINANSRSDLEIQIIDIGKRIVTRFPLGNYSNG